MFGLPSLILFFSLYLCPSCWGVFAEEEPLHPDIFGGSRENIPQGLLPPLASFPDRDMASSLGTVKEEKAESRVEIKGSKVYLDFRETDIKEVARVLSKISGVSILVSEDVKAKVTLNIEGVDWKKALELILKTYNLAYIEKDEFIMVVTYKKIQEEQGQIPLITKILPLNFVDLNEAKEYLKSIMTSRGNLNGDIRTNSLIVTDIPEVVEKIENITRELDKKTPQVLIEVLMVDRKLVDDFDFGIDWSITDQKIIEGDRLRSAGQTLSLSGATSASVTYGKSFLGYTWIRSMIELWKEEQKVDIVANPKILTLDNVIAKIQITEQIPYTSQSQSTSGSGEVITSTQFKDVGVMMNVKPHITRDNHIIMNIVTEQSFRSGFTPDNQPIIDSRKSETTMMVKNEETIVIGGLRKKDKTTTQDKVPILGDIPLLGKLFTRYSYDDISRELLIFVIPHVVKETPASEEGGSYEKKREIEGRKMLLRLEESLDKAEAKKGTGPKPPRTQR